jgi:cyclic pyranopterin phosphate synthase
MRGAWHHRGVMTSLDRLGRPLRNLRLSVTDRCNLRCSYCMPEEEYTWLPRADLLSFEELTHLARVFAGLGVEKLRLTGGEPLLRRGLAGLVQLLAGVPGVRDLALTTNGILLDEQAGALAAAGLARLTISLDTLVPERFRALTRRDELARVLAGIEAARAAGFRGTKLNTVVLRGVNDDELVALVEFARARALEVRFIEYMDVGGATGWSAAAVVSRAEILERLARELGPLEPDPAGDPHAPAERFHLGDGTPVGVIASTTAPFCRACDRARLTADGQWFTCLYARAGTDLRGPLRAGASDAELAARVLGRWRERDDRGAEERLALEARGRLASAGELRRDPHLEMHTRGG